MCESRIAIFLVNYEKRSVDDMPPKTIDAFMKRLERQIARTKVRVVEIKERHERIKSSGGTLTEHGGWELGYWEAKLSTLEDTLDDLKELGFVPNGKGE